jgi:hypothetical protein
MRLDAPSANRVILWEWGQGYAHPVDIPPALRDDLITYLLHVARPFPDHR